MNKRQKHPAVGDYYYHYKHNPKSEINNFAYEIIGIGHHTEIDGLSESAMVIYAPLYEESSVYQNDKHFNIRPLDMFVSKVTKNEKTFSRFKRVTNIDTIAKLQKIKKKLYKK